MSTPTFDLDDDRTHPVVFPYPYSYQDEVTIECPPGYRIGELSAQKPVSSSAGDCIITCRRDDTKILYTRIFSLKKDSVPSDQVKSFIRFCERVRQANDEEVVLARAL